MNWARLYHSARMCLITSAISRAKYIKKQNIFYHMGDNCMVMFRKIPLYPKLISIGDNVWIASNVHFTPHDVIHQMLNNLYDDHNFQENIGCIQIKDNCFIGAHTTILPDVCIGPNVVVAAGSLVNKSLKPNGVYGGVPAKFICSLEELVNKRKTENELIVKKNNGKLDSETVEKCWERFLNNQQVR